MQLVGLCYTCQDTRYLYTREYAYNLPSAPQLLCGIVLCSWKTSSVYSLADVVGLQD